MLFDVSQETTYDFVSFKNRFIFEKELTISKDVSIKSGSESPAASKINEWLDIWRYLLPEAEIDPVKPGKFNASSEEAVKKLQANWGMPSTGIVDPVFFSLLTSPMAVAFQKSLTELSDIREAVVFYAKQHRASVPLETFNVNNRGPWVRSYLNLYSFPDPDNTYDWCAAFVCTILDQAFSHFNEDFVGYIPRTAWVPDFSSYAYKNDIIIPYDQAESRYSEIKGGDIFMIYKPNNPLWRRTGTIERDRYIHTGLIERIDGTVITTIEGNKNFGSNETLQNFDDTYILSKIPENKGGVFSREFDLADPNNEISIVRLPI